MFVSYLHLAPNIPWLQDKIRAFPSLGCIGGGNKDAIYFFIHKENIESLRKLLTMTTQPKESFVEAFFWTTMIGNVKGK